MSCFILRSLTIDRYLTVTWESEPELEDGNSVVGEGRETVTSGGCRSSRVPGAPGKSHIKFGSITAEVVPISLRSLASLALEDLRLLALLPLWTRSRSDSLPPHPLPLPPSPAPGLDVWVCESTSWAILSLSLFMLSNNRSIHQYTRSMITQIFLAFTYSTILRKHCCISLAALSCLFQILVDETISSSFLVGNCFLNLISIWSCNFLNSSDSSTCPSTCLTRECKISRQCILFPFAMGKLKLTNATTFGFGIPKGGSRLAIKSLSWVNRMNCVACGSYL